MILFYLVLYSEILLPFPSLLDIAGIAKLMKRLKKKKDPYMCRTIFLFC